MVNENISMIVNRNKKTYTPLMIININDTYVLGLYQGSLSKYDILLRYRQKTDTGKWSKIRTPKHIHWAVDAIIKLNHDKVEMKKFLQFLLDMWNNDIEPINSEEDRNKFLNVEKLMEDANREASIYKELSNKGEYSIKFLYLIAKILMIQEKTNNKDAYMFKKLLDSLKDHSDIFKIVSVATHNRR